MTRTSRDHHDTGGDLVTGYDYGLQLWVKNYVVQNCGHPATMPNTGAACGCNGRRYAGLDIRELKLNLKRNLKMEPFKLTATRPPATGRAVSVYHGARFGDWLGTCDYDGELIIGGADMAFGFVWNAGDQLTDSGKKVFTLILNAPFDILNNGNIEIHGTAGVKLGELFTAAAAGHIPARTYLEYFKQ